MLRLTAFLENGVNPGLYLLPGLQKGEPKAVMEFVSIYRPRIHGFLWCILHSIETAEDMTQETMIRAYQKCNQIESPEKFESWLFTLARNLALKEMKKRRYLAEIGMEIDWFDSQPGAGIGEIIKKLNAEQSAILLKDALAILNEKPREIMALRYFSGLSLQQIADVTGIPLGSIGTTITRSLESLKKYFESRGIKGEDLL